MASELRTRAVLAPTMLLLVGAVYWLDLNAVLGLRQGALSAALLGLLGFAGTWEYVALMRGAGFSVARTMLLCTAAALHVSAFFFQWGVIDRELYPLVGFTLLLFYPLAVRSLGRTSMQKGLEEQGATLLGLILVSWPMFLAQGVCFRHLPSILFVVLVCKGGDIGGYVTGRAIGRHKLIPHVSPGKTVEGALGSLLASIGLAFWLRDPLLGTAVPMGTLATAAVGTALNVTTQTGDLVESLLKRRCGAKDSSRLLPAHGGVLDLIDSLLFSFAVFFLVLVRSTGGS